MKLELEAIFQQTLRATLGDLQAGLNIKKTSSLSVFGNGSWIP